MVLFGLCCCIRAKIVIFGQGGCIRQSDCIRVKKIVFGQGCCIREKLVVFVKNVAIRVKVVVFG